MDEPIDMVMHCPKCHLQYIDEADDAVEISDAPMPPKRLTPTRWTNPPHRSHLCHGCGHIWRPADVPTNGVRSVRTRGKTDSPIVSRAQ